jgi:hypothetical protein
MAGRTGPRPERRYTQPVVARAFLSIPFTEGNLIMAKTQSLKSPLHAPQRVGGALTEAHVAALHQRRAAAAAALEEARAQHRAAALDAALGDGQSGQRHEAARDAVTSAERDLTALDAAVEAATTRLAEEAAARARTERAARWAKAFKLGEAMAETALRVDMLAEALGEATDRLRRQAADYHATVPASRSDHDYVRLGRERIDGAVRVALARAGVGFDGMGLADPKALPTVAERVEETRAVIERAREDAA